MKVIHVIECFASGAAYSVNLLTQHVTDCEHVVIHGERADEISAEVVKSSFPIGVSFLFWENAQREIHPSKDIKALISLIKLLKQEKGDIVHLHSSKAGFLGRLACRVLGIDNVIYTPQGASFARKDISRFKHNLFVLLEKFADSMSGKVVCCSASEGSIFRDINIDATFINNGVALPKDYKEVQVNSSCKDKFTVITCGRVSEQKNPMLFNTIAKSLLHLKCIEFIWVGDGEKSKVSLLNSANIKITGWLDKTEVLEIVNNADLYISTAQWEGLPIAVLEAMSLGKPLLLSECVGNIDLVKNDFNGYSFVEAFEAVSKIVELSNYREQLATLGENSRKWCAEEFDVKLVYAKYQNLYYDINNNNVSVVK